MAAELALMRGWLRATPAWVFILLVIGAAALGLRLHGLDWDGGSFYHPDERSIYLRADCMYRVLTEAPGWDSCQNRDFPQDSPGFPGIGTFFDKDASPLNPHWFPLGTIIIYLLVGIRFVLEPFMDQVRLEDLASAGRALAAFADTASVLLLFFLGRRLFGQGAGLLAAALGAFTVFNIQVTHFYRPESFVVLLALVAFWWMLNVLERGRLRDHAVLGFVIGMTFAFRGSSPADTRARRAHLRRTPLAAMGDRRTGLAAPTAVGTPRCARVRRRPPHLHRAAAVRAYRLPEVCGGPRLGRDGRAHRRARALHAPVRGHPAQRAIRTAADGALGPGSPAGRRCVGEDWRRP